jgi:hypothetical protein
VAVVDKAPFTVRGSNFRPAERVALLVSVKGRWERTVVASSTGSFVTRFRRLAIQQCSGYFVRARGSHGSYAVIKVMPQCPPPVDGLMPLDPPPKPG